MSGYLLDTNVIVRVLNGDIALAHRLDELNPVYISPIVLGELIYGAEKSAKIDFNKKNALNFCSDFKSIGITKKVARVYGKIKADLERAGKTIPQNDLWISATAIANDLALVSHRGVWNRVTLNSFQGLVQPPLRIGVTRSRTKFGMTGWTFGMTGFSKNRSDCHRRFFRCKKKLPNVRQH